MERDYNAVGYIRIRATGGWVGGPDNLSSYCDNKGWYLDPRIIGDQVALASTPLGDRPGGRNLLQRLEVLGRFRMPHVVVLKLHHLFSNADEACNQLMVWQKQGVTLHLVPGGAISRTMVESFRDSFKAWQHMERVERATMAMKARKSQHQVFGPIPFGFLCKDGVLEEDPAQQAVISEVRARYNAGWSLQQIADELEHRGVRTKHARCWHHSTVRNLLQNPLYGPSLLKPEGRRRPRTKVHRVMTNPVCTTAPQPSDIQTSTEIS